MALERPPRTFADFTALTAEGVREIPRWSPGFTDHNLHDPGITLIELFAALTERLSYRSERSAPSRRRAFARRLGLETRGPARAETILTFEAPAGAPLVVPPATVVTGADTALEFGTASELTIQPGASAVELAGVVSHGFDETRVLLPFGPQPSVGASFGLKLPSASAGRLSLYFWSGATDRDRAVIERLAREQKRNPCLNADLGAHYSVELAFEALTANGAYRSIPVRRDTTRALTISGFVELDLPSGMVADSTGKFVVRCRLARGHYDAAPRFKRVFGNAVLATDGGALYPAPTALRFQVLGRAHGRAGERFPLDPRGTTLDTLEVLALPPSDSELEPGPVTVAPDSGQRFEPKLDWDRTSPLDRDVVVDFSRSELVFGDGRIGAVPEAGRRIAVRYRPRGGVSGNVAARTLNRVAAPALGALLVEQPLAAIGGAAGETLTSLEQRAFEVRTGDRAVTLDDLEHLARAAPGLPVARAKAFAEVHPDFPRLRAGGCVTLLVIPPLPDARPAPSAELLRSLERYLAPRRTLTAELLVTGPQYIEVGLAARLHVSGGGGADLAALAAKVFDDFVHPLRGGADAGGWPLGRDLERSAVLALLMSLPGVQAVDQFAFLLAGGERSACESVKVCPTWLIAPGDHEISVTQE